VKTMTESREQRGQNYFKALHGIRVARDFEDQFPGMVESQREECAKLWGTLPKDMRKDIGEPPPHTEENPWRRWEPRP
jgi:hypothetical protein